MFYLLAKFVAWCFIKTKELMLNRTFHTLITHAGNKLRTFQKLAFIPSFCGQLQIVCWNCSLAVGQTLFWKVCGSQTFRSARIQIPNCRGFRWYLSKGRVAVALQNLNFPRICNGRRACITGSISRRSLQISGRTIHFRTLLFFWKHFRFWKLSWCCFVYGRVCFGC